IRPSLLATWPTAAESSSVISSNRRCHRNRTRLLVVISTGCPRCHLCVDRKLSLMPSALARLGRPLAARDVRPLLLRRWARRPQLNRDPMVPAILFVLGASGAGKTSALGILAGRRLQGVSCYHFDSIGVPSAAVMEREWGSGERWQEEMTKHGIDGRAALAGAAVFVVLEGQPRPSNGDPHGSRYGVRHYRI